MGSSTTAERERLAYRDRTCCLRRCLPARPLRISVFRGSITHPTGSLCTLRTRRCRRLRNTHYRAPATAYPDRSSTGWIAPAFLAHKQSRPSFLALDCFAEPVIGRRFAPTRWLAMTDARVLGEPGIGRAVARSGGSR